MCSPGTCTEVHHRPVFPYLLRDDVDNAAHGIAAVKSRSSAPDDLDSLDILQGRNTGKRRAGPAHRSLLIIDAFAVHHDDDTLFAVDPHRLIGSVRSIRHDCTIDMLQGFGKVRIMSGFDFTGGNDGNVSRRIQTTRWDALRSDDGFAQIAAHTLAGRCGMARKTQGPQRQGGNHGIR